VSLIATEDGNLIFLKGKAGEEGIHLLGTKKEGTGIAISDRMGKFKWSAP
jgi:hypothetical protein